MAAGVEVGVEVEVEVTVGSGRRPLRIVTFKASPEFVERLNAFSRRLGKSRSEVIREALEFYMSLYGGSRVGKEGVH